MPLRLRLCARRVRNLVARSCEAPRWTAIVVARPRRDRIAVFYGRDVMPTDDDVVSGGAVKFAQLAKWLPNEPRSFNVLYLGSSSMPRDALMLARLARVRHSAFVWNQNGVAYPGWHGPGWESANRLPARLLREADHVIFQSAFCKLSAERFLGRPTGSWEILHNPVDTRRFMPAPTTARPLTLLLGGSRYQAYPVEVALRTLALVRRERSEARLIVSGAFTFARDAQEQVNKLVAALGLEHSVEFTGPYTRANAPSLIGRAHILIHPKLNDPCPTTVLEAMACGVPVVYSATGGTPELVGDDGGVGVPGPLDWECDRPPAAEALAAAVLRAAAHLPELRTSTRERAVTRFGLERWVQRHQQLFEELFADRAR